MSKLISVAFHICFGARFPKEAYLPMLRKLGGRLEKCYGIGFQRGYVFSDEPVEKLVLTKLFTRIGRCVFRPYCKFFHIPDGKGYLWQVKLFDMWVAHQIKSDKADILFTSVTMGKTIKAAKKMGKKVVLLAELSAPTRQYQRYMLEKHTYGIKSYTVYGDEKFMLQSKDAYAMSDHIIAISEVSYKTYLEEGYDVNKFTIIPLTASSLKISGIFATGKTKAFISTAFHSLIKGTHRLLLAWKRANIFEIPLIIVGTLHEDMLEFVEKYGPFKGVIFVGHKENLSEFYQDYDAVGILISFSEAAGRTTTELMSQGFPMIVSPDATCDIVQEGINGFIVEPTDEDKLVDRLCWFAKDWERAHKMRENAISAVKKQKLSEYGAAIAECLLSL